MPIPYKDVVNFFLQKSIPYTEAGITHLKLQKLVYYAQVWNLVLNNREPIIDEEFEAWVHGPVCSPIYHDFKQYGFRYIPVSNENIDISEEHLEVLELVWELYGELDARYLEELTHQELPWIIARGTANANDPLNVIIDRDSMYDYYSERLIGAGV